MEKEMVRINTRISSYANEWLDKRAIETGLSKSAMVMLAIENYIQQTEAMKSMGDMNEILKKIEELGEKMAK